MNALRERDLDDAALQTGESITKSQTLGETLHAVCEIGTEFTGIHMTASMALDVKLKESKRQVTLTGGCIKENGLWVSLEDLI